MKAQEQYLSVIKFPSFVSLMLIILGLLLAWVIFIAYRGIWPTKWVSAVLVVCFVTMVFLVLMWIVTLRSTYIRIRTRWLQKLSKWMLIHVFYNLANFFRIITFSNRNVLTESFLNFNNETVLTDQLDVRNSNIMLLLPHCLQKSDCPVRVTSNIFNCEECGGCDIAGIKRMAAEHQVKAALATGGTLARKLLQDYKPNVIVAVACHRDLLDGVRDAWHLPIYAVLNERPKGPCFETRVNLASIEFAIQRFK